jgi:hypothetical protein
LAGVASGAGVPEEVTKATLIELLKPAVSLSAE